MKLIKRLFMIFFALILVGGIGLYIFIANFDANKYKPLIVEKATEALGREVDFKDIALQMSLSEGIRAAIHELRISENPNYGKGDFLKVNEVFVGVNILAYITQKEISLTGITVDSPDITIIKGTDGKMSVETLGKKKDAVQPGEPGTAAKAAAIPALLVKQLSIKNGKVTFIDRSQGGETKATLTQLDFGIEDLSLTDTFPVWLKVAAFAEKQNISVKGRVKLDLLEKGAAISDVDAELDLSQTDTAQLKALPAMKGKPLPEVLKGKLTAHIGQFSTGKNGLGPIAADIALSDGAVKFAQVSPGVALDIPSLDFTLKNFAPGKEGTFDLKIAYLNSAPNITATGNLTFDQATQRFKIGSGRVDADLATISLDALKASVASLKDTDLPQNLKGKLAISELNVLAGGADPAAFSGKLAVTDGSAKLIKLPAPPENIAAAIGFTQNDIDISNLSFNLGKGSLSLTGDVADYKASKSFRLNLVTKDIPIDALIDQSQAKEKAEGLLTVNADVSGSAAQLDTTLDGKGDLSLAEGKLVGVNVLARVLEKISILNLGQANLPRVWQHKLQKQDTEITRLEAAATITDGVATITPIDVEAEGFLFNGKGTYGMAAKRYQLDGAFVIPPAMAAEMTASLKEMQYLMNAQKEIRFPLTVEGEVGGKSSFTPHVTAVVKDALQNKGKDQLLRVLDKKWNKDGKNSGQMDMLKGFLGVPKEEQPAEPAQPPQQPAPASQVPASQTPASQQPQGTAPAEPEASSEQQLMQGIMKGFGQ